MLSFDWGQLAPMARYLFCFFLGSSLLFLRKSPDDSPLQRWQGIMISLPRARELPAGGQVFLLAGRGNKECLAHKEPFLLITSDGHSPALLLPRRSSSLGQLHKILKGRYRLVKDSYGQAPCSLQKKRVRYG